MAKDAEQLQRIMANLKCTEEEAAEIMAYDKAVDKGEKTILVDIIRATVTTAKL